MLDTHQSSHTGWVLIVSKIWTKLKFPLKFFFSESVLHSGIERAKSRIPQSGVCKERGDDGKKQLFGKSLSLMNIQV